MQNVNLQALFSTAETVMEKTWGKEYWIVNNDSYCFKILEIYEDQQCSVHYHKLKKETFIGFIGEVFLMLEKEIILLSPGRKVTLDPFTLHRFKGFSPVSYFLEVSTFHLEEDSYRIHDPNILFTFGVLSNENTNKENE